MIFHADEIFLADDEMISSGAERDSRGHAIVIAPAPVRNGLMVALAPNFSSSGYRPESENVEALVRLLECEIVEYPAIIVAAHVPSDAENMLMVRLDGCVPIVVIGSRAGDYRGVHSTTQKLSDDPLPFQFHNAVAAALSATVEYEDKHA